MANSLNKILKEKVSKYADELGIGDYKYKVILSSKSDSKDGCSDSHTYATVAIDEETRTVYISLNKKLLVNKPEEIERTIVHELLHVRLNELLNFNSMLMEKYIKNKKAKDTYTRQLDLLEHKIIVSLTEALKHNG